MSLDDLRAEVQAAEAALDALRSAAAEAAATYDAQLAALGKEPAVPPEPRDPVAPVRNRPTVEDLTAARAMVATAGARNALHARHTAALAAAEREHAATAATAAQRSDRAEVVSAHLAAARRAPADLLRGQIGALGDLGPLVLEVPERDDTTPRSAPWIALGYRHADGTVAPIVDVGGASTGERAEAALWLAMGIRRAAAKHPALGSAFARLPVVADLTARHGAALPLLRGIVWLEEGTAEGEPLTVRA